jgi:hypothetical protein
VQVDVAPLGLERGEALARLQSVGVGLSPTPHRTVLRAVTHLEIDDDEITRASKLIPEALLAAVAG